MRPSPEDEQDACAEAFDQMEEDREESGEILKYYDHSDAIREAFLEGWTRAMQWARTQGDDSQEADTI